MAPLQVVDGPQRESTINRGYPTALTLDFQPTIAEHRLALAITQMQEVLYGKVTQQQADAVYSTYSFIVTVVSDCEPVNARLFQSRQ
jgi:hypothetical protein